MKKLAIKSRQSALGGLFITLLLVLTFSPNCDLLPNDKDFEPTGNPYTLNPNIELIRIQESKTRYNPTGTFSLDFIARSKSGNTESANLPAGLFFLASNKKVQNTIIVKDYQIPVTSVVDTFTLGVFSVNEFKDLPGDADYYTIGPITDNPDLNQIIDIVRHKRLDASNVLTVQRAIYQVTSGDSLSSTMLESLNMLPPESDLPFESTL
uniref:Uncharacterized protein n=1 Tax=candidate division WOR-3 bacterium TaxID=2052148 RepID=A0A7C6A9F8_UNCW3